MKEQEKKFKKEKAR